MNAIIYALYNEYHMPALLSVNSTFPFEHCEIIGNAESNGIPLKFATSAQFYDWRKILIDYPNTDWAEILPLSQDLILEMRDCETAVFRMMDRNSEDVAGAWSYNFRKIVYYRHLRYWNHIITNRKFDCFLSLNIPHEIIDFIIFSLCKKRGIPTYFFYQFQPDITFMMSDWKYPIPDYIRTNDGYKSTTGLSARLRQEFETQTNPTSRPIPFYMKTPIAAKRISLLKKISAPIARVAKNLKAENRARAINLRWRAEYAEKLSQELNRAEVAPVNGEKYIYLPLHLQPELSTSPMAGQYVEQILMAQMVTANLPKDCFLYVKEHPAQNMAQRPPEFYANLMKLKKLRIIRRTADSFQLLQGAIAVATATGTAGWEAIFRLKPVLLFGFTFYQNAPGVYRIYTQEDCRLAMKQIMSGHTEENTESLVNYLHWLDKYLIPGNIDAEYEKASVLTHDESIRNIASRLTTALEAAIQTR